MTVQHHDSLPLDTGSAERLATLGLRLGLVDRTDDEAFGAWLQADARGFHEPRYGDDQLPAALEAVRYRRTTGVWDDALPTKTPVATVSSWVAELTVSPGRVVEAWAISSVTVTPTAAGKGIARALLEAELRTASAAGCPLAILTVSESTLYRRYGFAPAALSADWRFDTRRVTWTGPIPDGRVELTEKTDARRDIDELKDRVRLQGVGQIDIWSRRWDQVAGLANEEPDREKAFRGARYLDADGVLRGTLIYRVTPDENSFVGHTLTVEHLMSETPDAYAALWRFALSMPLVSTVVARSRPVDEAVRWQIADFRAARSTTSDHLWTRVLDVPAAIAARSYDSAGSLALEVSDPLGYTTGTWLFEAAADGSGTARAVDAAPGGMPTLALDVSDLSSIYLGGVSAVTLTDAGRVTEKTPGAAVAADLLFSTPRAPWLPLWF
ncbi:GNAT family N-acetyltransferase [Amnibacterium flavum]|uniref:GNAT family N-acetyltransferase n=1 Tax=Amnibacterium flavum TaxID=2173173 RepID=A0A2V1HR44_9MICO|nr:GNAT family N-acetyltransferase [Amnibacterium flavum]PVZ95008.1 GNAT family N-acetyltransferase [Amnibacterium flavum]